LQLCGLHTALYGQHLGSVGIWQATTEVDCTCVGDCSDCLCLRQTCTVLGRVRTAYHVPCTGATWGATSICCTTLVVLHVDCSCVVVQHDTLLSAAPRRLLPCVASAALMLWQKLQDSLLCPLVVCTIQLTFTLGDFYHSIGWYFLSNHIPHRSAARCWRLHSESPRHAMWHKVNITDRTRMTGVLV
jgi:hypothetical protein